MERTALFAGTFDPFTKGHHALVLRALAIFDKVVVAVGHNMGKKCLFSVEQRVEAIEKLYAADKRVEVMTYDGLTMDLAKEIGATALLRGVRNTKDFEYEREIADVNFRIGGIETVLLMSEPEHASLSSSIVRELMNYGKDVTALLPNMQE